MSENGDGTTEDTESTVRMNRRHLLRSVGAGAVGVTGLGVTSGDVRGAETNNIQEMTGSEKHKSAAKARQADDFKTLSAHLKEEGKYVHVGSDVTVYEVRGEDGLDYQLVDFKLKYAGPRRREPDTKIGISIALQDGSFYASRGSETEVKMNESGTSATVSDTQYEVVDGKVEAETNETKVSASDTSPSGRSSFTAQSSFTTQDVEIPCGFCQTVSNQLCSVGCSITSGFFCLLLGVTGVGGVLCATAFATLCGFVNLARSRNLGYYCALDQAGEALCRDAGYC